MALQNRVQSCSPDSAVLSRIFSDSLLVGNLGNCVGLRVRSATLSVVVKKPAGSVNVIQFWRRRSHAVVAGSRLYPTWLTSATTLYVLTAVGVLLAGGRGVSAAAARGSQTTPSIPKGLSSRRAQSRSTTTTTTSTPPPPPTTTTEPVPVDRLYIGRRTLGRLTCPLEAEPPSTVIVWTRNGSVLEPMSSSSGALRASSRTRVSPTGTLVIRSADTVDEGYYACAVYSPHGTTEVSPTVHVLVRGQHSGHFAHAHCTGHVAIN